MFFSVIGDDVIVGAGAIIHGCVIESGALIGVGAQVMDGAVVEANAEIAPGAIVGARKRVPSGQVWAGIPATFLRNRSATDIEKQSSKISENSPLGSKYEAEVAKSFQTIDDDLYAYEQTHDRSEYYYRQISKEVNL